MKIKNPAYVDPILEKVNARKAAVQTYLQTNAALEIIEFDQIRTDNPTIAEDLTDSVILEICKSLGIEVRQ